MVWFRDSRGIQVEDDSLGSRFQLGTIARQWAALANKDIVGESVAVGIVFSIQERVPLVAS